MRNRLWPRLGCLLAACLAVTVAWGYDIIRNESDGALVTYNPGSIPIQIKLGTDVTLEDGTNFSTTVLAAMTEWNPEIGAVQFAGTIVEAGPGTDGDGVNEIIFSDTIYGEAYGENTLAVTLSWVMNAPRPDGTYQRTQSDILFNTAKIWNSYRGAHRYGGPYDMRRVAIHELGHVLGLGHPDEAVPPQSVTAIMNSTISNIDAIKPDDRAGAQYLYGPGSGTVNRPANDDFAAAFAVNLVNNAFTWNANNYGATKEPGEPNHAPDESGGTSVWWKWTAPGPGSMTITTAGSSFDTMLAAYTGSAVSALTQIASNDDVQSGVIRTSSITFATTTGTTYYIAVDGWDAWTGVITLNLNFTPEVVNTAPVITSHPANRTVTIGQTAQFSVAASGTPAPTYRWQCLPSGSATWGDLYDGGGYTGTGATTLTVFNPTLTMSGDQFRCMVTNSAGYTYSNAAVFTVVPIAPTITANPTSKIQAVGTSVTFTAAASGVPTPSLQWQKNGTNIPGATSASYTIASLTLDDAGGYRMMATNVAGNVFSNVAVLEVGIAPSINIQPLDRDVFEGQSVGFSVAANEGSATAVFQWRKNQQNLPGATGATYSIAAASQANAGSYDVVVSNAYGSVTSRSAILVVRPLPPQITAQPANRTCEPSESVQFSLSATASSVISYQWQRLAAGQAEWVSLVAGANYQGFSSSTLTVSGVTESMDGDQFRCVVSNTGGSTLSSPATLSVHLPSGVVAVAQVRDQTYMLRYDGTLWLANMSQSRLVQMADNVAFISAGSDHLMIIKADRTLWGFGSNSSGQIGDGTMIDRAAPVFVASDVARVSPGAGHTLFLKTDGSLWGMGENSYGTLFDGTLDKRLSPHKVMDEAVAMAAAISSSYVVRTDGILLSVGSNSAGQLGDGGINVNRRRFVRSADGVVEVSANQTYALYIKEQGSLWRMGMNATSHLKLDEQVRSLSSGYYHYVYVKTDNSLWGGGSNGSGMLGSAPPDQVNGAIPIDVEVDAAVVALSPFGLATTFIKEDGSTWTTGINRLIFGGSYVYWSPVKAYAGQVPIPYDVSQVVASQGTTNGVRLSWLPVVSASFYDILRSETNDSASAVVVASVSGQCLYQDRGGTPGVTYYYWVRARNPAGTSALGTGVPGHGLATARPAITAQPQNLSVDYGNAANITLVATGTPAPFYQWQRFKVLDGTWVDIELDANYSGVCSDSLHITQPVATTQLRCRLENGAGVAISEAVTMTVNNGPPMPSIQVQPQSQNAMFNGIANFSVVASGEALTYQWQVRSVDGTAWENISSVRLEIFTPPSVRTGENPTTSAPAFSGSGTATLTVNRPRDYVGRSFRCLVSNFVGEVATDAVVLSVTFLPLELTVQPVSQAVLAGASVQLSVTVLLDSGPVQYQWQRESVDIPGATYASLTLSNFQAADSGRYRVVVTNGVSTVISHEANLALASIPVITAHPQSRTDYSGETASFSVTATSAAAQNYQWRKNGSAISGATQPVYSIPLLQLSDAGDYTVVVSNIAGAVESNPASLVVLPPIAPQITLQPAHQAGLEGVTLNYVIAATGAPTPTHQWQIMRRGDGEWSDISIGQAQHSGSFTNTLTVNGITAVANDGAQYRCIVSNVAASVISNAAQLTVIAAGPLKLSAGRYHSLRLNALSQLYVTGTNTYGQLGDGTTTNVTTAKPITIPGQTVTDVAAGAQHSLFLTSTGQVWASGFNGTGQLGDGTNVARSTPALLTTNAVGIAAANFHSVVLKADGTLWTVGGNDSGQLGNGTTTDTTALAQVATDVVDLAAGIRQTFFIKADGTLWGMGDMNGSGTPVSTPIQLATNVRTVAAGGYHSLLLKTDGTLWALGYNPFGQLGTGDTTDRLTPVQVATGVKAIAAGYFHSAFIKTDNTLWLMGYNSSGQLGDGTTTNRPAPFQLATNVAAVSANEAYTLYTRTDGSLWGTGYNAYGQFGNSGTAVTASPVQIATGVILAPEAPAGLAAAPSVSFDRVRLLWTHQGSAATYEVWRHSANNSANATLLASGLRWPVFEDCTVALGQAYYYWIKAVNSAGSTFSAPASASTGASLSQTITFTGPLDQPYSATPITLIATASSGLPVSFSLVSGPATLTDDQLTLTGVGTVTVRASQAGGAGYDPAPDVDRVFTVSANFDSWGLAHFTGDELNNAAISGPNADPDGDGYANLVEYGLGLGPKTASTTGLPEVTADATHWIYTYTRPEGRTDVTCTVEVSVDLSGWGAPTVAGVLVSANAGVETWQAKQPLTSANTFFRLKVSQ